MQDTLEKLNCRCCFSKISSYPCHECGFNEEEYQPDPIVLPIGSILQDRYVIGGVIGKGGFGITYLAYDKKLERKIAVKEYYPYGLALRATEDTTVFITGDDGVFHKGADRFYNEAKMIARFNSSPNIVNIYDFFYENGTVYYVMEYLRGRTLRSYVENIGCLTPGQAVYIALQISDALMTAHSESILHRDISPDNIMLCSDGKVKLIDFGAARQVASEYSQTLSVILTQGFAPLEQYQKKGKQGPWTDIYSLGASLYYGLTGCILDDPMSRLEDDKEFEKNPFSVNEELWTVIRKAVMLKIPDRHESAAQFRDELEKLNIAPETVKISEAQIKDTLKRISRSISGKAQPVTSAAHSSEMKTMPVKSSSQMQTMPVKNSSQMQTMPVKSSSQIQTMPVNSSSQMRTMPVYDEYPNKAHSEAPRETADSVKNKLIPVISVLATVVVMLIIGIIVIVVRDDEAEIVYEGTDSASVSAAYDETASEKSSESKTVTSHKSAANEQTEISEKEKPADSSPPPDKTETEPSAASQPKKDEKPKKNELEAPEAPKPESETPKPVTEAPKPVTEAPKPVTEAPKPVTEAPKPVTEAPKPVTEPSKPVTEAPKPVTTEASKPATEYTIAGKTYSVTDKELDWMSVDIQKNTTSEELGQLVYFPYLETLNLNFDELTKEECEKLDLSFLGQLNINHLTISNYRGKDISFLQGFEGHSNFNKLFLNVPNVTDFSVLKKLTQLEQLGLTDCDKLTELSFLKNYDSLKKLAIESPNVKDISGIEYAASTLEDVVICDNEVLTDISPLKKCKNISKIEFISVKIKSFKSLDPLASLPNLRELNLAYCGLTKKSDYDFLNKISTDKNEKIDVWVSFDGSPLEDHDKKTALFEELKNDEEFKKKFVFHW